MKEKRKRLGGIVPATATPFKQDGSIHADALLKLLEMNMEQGAESFFIGGSSAECFLLLPEERELCFEIAAQVKDKAYLVAHAGAIATSEAIRYAKRAGELGFDAVAATPPFYYGFGSREICAYYYDIAEAAGSPVIIYNFPGNTGKNFDVGDPNFVSLLKSGAILGVKHTNQVVYQMERIKNVNPNLIMMNGFDETMIAGFALGADGSIGSTFNFMLPHFLKLAEAYKAGSMEEALRIQIRANNIMYALCSVGLIPAIKYILTTMGIEAGEARRPFMPLTGEQKKMVDAVLKDNLLV